MLVAFSLTLKGWKLKEEMSMCFVHKIQELSEINPCYIVKCLINSKSCFQHLANT